MRPRLLFVCVENSCRSQMAEAFARMAGCDEAHSAGSAPSGCINSRAVASMAELGYDLDTHRSTSASELPHDEFDVVVTMGCGDRCPAVAAKEREDWDIPDPKALEPDAFRAVRDTIRAHVAELLARF